jgi:hypothetical protein
MVAVDWTPVGIVIGLIAVKKSQMVLSQFAQLVLVDHCVGLVDSTPTLHN